MLTFLSANILSLANERWLRQLDAVVIISVNTKDFIRILGRKKINVHSPQTLSLGAGSSGTGGCAAV